MSSFSPGTVGVYPDVALLWRSLRCIQSAETFSPINKARILIEEAFTAAPHRAPLVLELATAKVRSVAERDSAAALHNTLVLDHGYRAEKAWASENVVPSRLGLPTITLRLARWEGGRVLPWESEARDSSWELSEVRIPQSWFEELMPMDLELAAAIERTSLQFHDRGQWAPIIPLALSSKDRQWQAHVRNKRGNEVLWIYTPEQGLERASPN